MDGLKSPATVTGLSESLPPLESFSIFKDKLSQNNYCEQLDDKQIEDYSAIDNKMQSDSGKRKLDETDIQASNAAKKPKIWSISEIIGL